MNVVQDTAGNSLSAATITVYNAGTVTVSTLYSDNISTGKSNPFTNDTDGSFEFYAANGRYDVVIAKTGYTFDAASTSDVLLEDVAQSGVAITAPTITGTITGTYTLGGTPTVSAGLVLATGSTTARSLALRFDEIVDVKDYGALGDNSTDDQTALAAAVADAYAAGKHVYWPIGTYVTTASIANFHDVKHFGPGVVKRGSDLFYITQLSTSHANDIYVATTGNDANDGLSSTQPMLTIQRSFDVAKAWKPLQYLWTIWLAAGTYSEAASLDSGVSMNNDYLIIRGPALTKGTASAATTNAAGYATGSTSITLASAGTGTLIVGDVITFAGDTQCYRVTTGDTDVSNGGTIVIYPALQTAIPAATTAITVKTSNQLIPTAIIDYPASGIAGIDINWNNKVKVQDIKFTDWLSPASGGLLADQGCVLWTYNVHTRDCRQGIVGTACKLYVQGGIHSGYDWTTGAMAGGHGSVGVVTYAGAHCSLGYGGTNEETGTILENFVSRGYEGKAQTHCVSTWATFQSNNVGVFLYTDARFDDRTNIFRKNALVYNCRRGYLSSDQQLGASEYNYGATYDQTPNDVGKGNFSIWKMYGHSTDEAFLHGDGTSGNLAGIGVLDVCHQRDSDAQTGVIASTLTRTLATVHAGALAVNNDYSYYYEVHIHGASTGAVDTKTVLLTLAGVTVTTLTIATGTVAWSARVYIWPTTNYTSVVQITEAINATIGTVRSTIVGLDHWTDQDLDVYIAVPGAADTCTLHEARVLRWG